jgi:hypothetical protein
VLEFPVNEVIDNKLQLGVGVIVGVFDGWGVFEGVKVEVGARVNVTLGVRLGVRVSVGVYVFVGVNVSVAVGEGVKVGVLVAVGVGVMDGVKEAVGEGIDSGGAIFTDLLDLKSSTLASRMVVSWRNGQACIKNGVIKGWLKSTPICTLSPGPPGSSKP